MKTRLLAAAAVFYVVLLLLPVSTLAKDTWINVRSKNFNLIGNASEKDIRAVATKLEQFRETFRLLFAGLKFTNAIQTNVVVFKNSSSFKPFKPKRADGKADEWLAGYFQSGEDVNYIAISTEGEKEDTYGIIFHEYVHYMVDTNFGKSDVPPWFNEGLAEYYQTFQIKEDQKVLLGNLQDNHLALLQSNKMIPLRQFFGIDNYSLHQNGNHSRSIFYAQAWALIHYLIQANHGANRENMGKFLALVMRRVEPETALKQAFGYDYPTMEKELQKYVGQRTFVGTMITLKEKLVFDADITTAALSDAEANAYLGDLLYHTHEFADAEKQLQTALSLDENSSLANTSMGLVKMRQHKFPEAKSYLEKAVASGQRNHYAYYNYAYVLSRENMDEFNYVSSFPAEKAEKMRAALKKSIEINPEFAESYRLLGFINVVNDENLDEALTYLKKGLALKPGDQDYLLTIAQIYARQAKFKDASMIAQKILDTAGDDAKRQRAQSVLSMVQQMEQAKAYDNDIEKRNQAAGSGRPVLVRSSKPLTQEEIDRLQKQHANVTMNKLIEKPAEGEKQSVGYFQKVACAKGEIVYTFKTESEILTLAGKDFAGLKLLALTPEANELAFGCAVKAENILTAITYRPAKDSKSGATLSSIAFVPGTFKLMSANEIDKVEKSYADGEVYESPEAISEQASTPADKQMSEPKDGQADFEQQRREAMMQQIRNAMRKPQTGEKQVLGTVAKIECLKNKIVFHIMAGSQLLKFRALNTADIKISVFSAEAGGLQMGCNTNVPQIPAVITYTPDSDPKAKENGLLMSVEFVPRSFKLE